MCRKEITTKRNFNVKMSKSEVVAAVLPIQEHWLPLSNLDLLLPPLDVGVIFCYQNPISVTTKLEFGSMVRILKSSLAETLVIYYAFAGEIVQNLGGEPEVLCNNSGVNFTEAFADVELKDINFYNPDESIEGKLVPKKKHGVLAVQVTQLKCGGLVVGCTFDHRVADAYSANLFLVSWSELAQSKPLSQLPSFRRSFLFPRRPGYYDDSIDGLYVPIPTLPSVKPETLNPNDLAISRIYYITGEKMGHLQALANRDQKSTKFQRSKLESFSAYLWKTIACGSKETSNSKNFRFGIVVDGRARLSNGDDNQEKLLKGYFGNVLSIPFGNKKIEELKEKPLSWVANSIHEFIEKAVTREHFLGLIDWVEAHRPEQAVAKIYATDDDGPAVVVSSGQQFPAREIDFGWGEPVFWSYHFPWAGKSGYVMPMPSPKGNGDWIVYMHLMKWQLELIETSASHVVKPVTANYLNLM
ncbi:coniferyl alcohol acyltransferase-like [Nicotiana tabacum]|uniref:Coniferyl alcohol acyltransferase-like n=2 Tax=Nicotiana TaxID=4085 RepID=A0A1S3X7N0_TOBAC|nr:PREDICTED: shikimate O-hydroxycinnamoyltransferase-like [Nicotiana sylvestris]XP_016435902.1 PREDICTED: shikimate O-hydroxycinnamoyltransferase-like [Nicotiana tabacum]